MAESLEQLDLLLLTVAKMRRIQADGVRFQGRVFEDRASGARADRPGLRQALDYAREGAMC
jgi:DNA invertase Pin-like site-specific DNA recombinase